MRQKKTAITAKMTRGDDSTGLRKNAKKIARKKATPADIGKISLAQMERTIHELQVHQIELEMQNEELRHAQSKLDAAGARFFDFYDLAPVGYITLSENGLILESNLTAATMLGVVKGELVKKPLYQFILPKDKDICYLQQKQLFETTLASSGQAGKTQVYELRMVKKDGETFWVRFDTIAAKDTDNGVKSLASIILKDWGVLVSDKKN